MKRSMLSIIALVVILCFGTTLALAQHVKGGGAGAPGRGPSSGASHGSAGAHGSNANTSPSSKSGTDVLNSNAKLDSTLTSKLQSKGLLPAGTDLKTACTGFRNLGQCMAAIHVSHNRKISFDCLKADMTGAAPSAGSTCPANTGTKKMSLGQAIQTLDPNADAKTEAKKANKQADDDLKESGSRS